MGAALAASLAIHGIALGALVLSARSQAPGLDGALDRGAGQRGAPSGFVLVRLLHEGAAATPAAAAESSTPEARALAVPPPPRPPRPSQRAEPESTSPPLRSSARRGTDAGPPAPAPPRRASLGSGAPGLAGSPGPPGGPIPGGRLGAGGGSDAGPLDRAARPAAPIRPRYPPRARQRGDEADVVLDVWVGAGGDVDRVAVSRSAGAEFDAAALAAVRRARFHPALRQGLTVPSRVALRLHFRLDR